MGSWKEFFSHTKRKRKLQEEAKKRQWEHKKRQAEAIQAREPQNRRRPIQGLEVGKQQEILRAAYSLDAEIREVLQDYLDVHYDGRQTLSSPEGPEYLHSGDVMWRVRDASGHQVIGVKLKFVSGFLGGVRPAEFEILGVSHRRTGMPGRVRAKPCINDLVAVLSDSELDTLPFEARSSEPAAKGNSVKALERAEAVQYAG